MAASQPEVKSYLSPDGQWRTEITLFPCTSIDPEEVYAYEALTLVRIADGEETVVDRQLINCGGLGAFGLDGIGWAPDSRTFDYTNAREGMPDGASGDWERPVLRLDVTTQSVRAVPGD